MKLILCSIFDSATQAFGRPAFVHATGQAVRQFSDEVNRQADDNELYKHASDFTLYQIGTFDDSNGYIDSLTPAILVRGSDAKLKA